MNWVAPIKDDETLQKFRDTLRSVDDKYYILFEIGIGTGLQLQDILQFKVKDVRGKDMLIAVIGTRQIEQAFPLKPELQAVITDFIDGRDDDEYLITGYASTNRHRLVNRLTASLNKQKQDWIKVHWYADHAKDFRVALLQGNR